MSYTPTPPIWGFNDGYSAQLLQFPRHDNLSVSSDITTQYSTQNWFQFAGSLPSRTFNCDVDREGSFAGNNQEEEMSEGIRALLEITKNVKNDSKFEGIPYTRSQDSMSEGNVFQRQHQNGNNHRALQAQYHQQQQQSSAFRITGLPHATQHQPLATKNTNYAMAVKKTLEPKKAPNVVYRQQEHHQQKQKSEPRPSQEPTTQEVATEAEPLTWFDKNGRRTVNAKEMEGGPKINGRSVVNGINLNSLKFVKPSRQCPKWDISKHRIEEPNCALWHPRERCQYYPRCRLTAEVCGFGHPFCCDEGQYCKCAPEKRSLQLNHLLRKDAVDVLPIRQKAHSG